MTKKIPQRQIYELLADMEGTVGLYVECADTGEVFEINPGRVFPSASVIKIPMLALLLRDVEQGKADWNAPCPIAPQNRVGGTGILSSLDAGYTPSLAVLAKLMIVLSDNTATNQIMDMVGIERVCEFCREQGWPNTRLMRKMLDAEAVRQGRNNYMCAGETGRMLSQIARGALVSESASRTIVSLMEQQQCVNKLPSLLPAIPSWAPQEERTHMKPDTVLVANKTGDLTCIQHDVGIFTLPDGRRYIIAMFTSDLPDNHTGINTIARLSRLVYDALK